MNLEGIDTSDLTDDDDLLELSDRFRLRLKIEHDPDSSVNDYDADGKVEWGRRHPYTDRAERPEGFDGAAVILYRDGRDVAWWQPYGTGPGSTKQDTYGWQDEAGEWHHARWHQLPHAERQRQFWRVHDLWLYGFKQVGLALEENVRDSFEHDHWVQVDVAWIGGVDEFYPELIGDLASELPDMTPPAPAYV